MTILGTAELYAIFLASDWWVNLSRRKRRKIGRCEKCGSKKSLQCHHLVYPDNWFDVTMDDLKVLCSRCHKKEHGISVPIVTTYTRKQRHEWRMDYQKRMKARKKAKNWKFP